MDAEDPDPEAWARENIHWSHKGRSASCGLPLGEESASCGMQEKNEVNQPNPQLVVARSEGEELDIADYREHHGNNP